MDHLKDLKIAITGGSGFLGRHLLAALDGRCAEIVCLARGTSRFKHLPRSARLVPGDCHTGEGLAALAENSNVFIHMASLLFGASWHDYLEANARASQNVCAAINSLPEAKRPGKVIFISSLAAAGPCAKLPGLNEKALPAPVSAYGWSKLLSEKIFTSAGLGELVILRPPIIYGSGDRGLLPMFKSAARGLGLSPGMGRPFPVSIIHASDVAQAILLACSQKAQGIYHLDDGHPCDMDAFCRAMGNALQRKSMHVIHMPLGVMGATAAISSAWAQSAGGMARLAARGAMPPPRWNMDKFREARQAGWLADAARIRGELGFDARTDLKTGMQEAVQGYREEGLL